MGKFSGRNIAVESVANLLFAKCGLKTNLLSQSRESRSFLFIDNVDNEDQPRLESIRSSSAKNNTNLASSESSDPDDIVVDTQSETLRLT